MLDDEEEEAAAPAEEELPVEEERKPEALPDEMARRLHSTHREEFEEVVQSGVERIALLAPRQPLGVGHESQDVRDSIAEDLSKDEKADLRSFSEG